MLFALQVISDAVFIIRWAKFREHHVLTHTYTHILTTHTPVHRLTRMHILAHGPPHTQTHTLNTNVSA